MAHKPVVPILLVLLSSILAGCATDGGEGSASLYVKDKVTDDYREVHIVFQTATVHQAGGEAEDDGDESGWRVVVTNTTTGIDVDLLNATGANAVLLGEADLPAGRYTQIRILVQQAYAIDHEGQRVELNVPSGIVRVVKSFEVEEGKETRIVLDFDLERSIICTGQGACHLRPVVGKTTVEVVPDEESGEDTAEVGETAPVAGA